MKLRNKKTGEIYEPRYFQDMLGDYGSIKALTDEWEDYEEPKEYWCIDWTGGVNHIIPLDDSKDISENNKKQIGNYFETKEEAEKAVEKLKAWKRLKDNGFRFIGYNFNKLLADEENVDIKAIFPEWDSFKDDLDSLFGGEDDN